MEYFFINKIGNTNIVSLNILESVAHIYILYIFFDKSVSLYDYNNLIYPDHYV